MTAALGYLLIFYALAGLATAIAFVVVGLPRALAASPNDRPAAFTLGARVLLIPGSFALWPYVLWRWLRTSHRA